MKHTIAVVDFGGQYTHLIANRIRRLGVYSAIVPADTPAPAMSAYKGIVLSGSPHSVTDPGAPPFDPGMLELGVPVLGLCYGHQLIARTLGGVVERGTTREYGSALMQVLVHDELFGGLDGEERIWMSHGDTVVQLPDGFEVIGSTTDCPAAAVRHAARRIYGLQFHPEVTDTPHGMQILDNFVRICGAERQWDTDAFVREIAETTRREVGDRRVFMLVSGGVDSTVAFLLLNNVLGPDKVLGLHIDNGLMRLGESAEIMRYMKEHGFDNLHVVDESEAFLDALDGVADPERKRERIGRMFIEVQQRALAGLGLNADEWLLGQGTIYPDTIESAGTAHADRIKTHHNRVDIVVELIEKGLVIEPLKLLYKDEVRQVGEALGLPRNLVWRHPFPGPGLGVRVLCWSGDDNPPDAATVEQVAELAEAQGYGSMVLPVRSVGVQGDSRTYAHPALLFGDPDWGRLEALSTRITNTVSGVNRVVYAVSADERPRYELGRAFVTRERLDILRRIDHRATELLHEHDQYGDIWQMPVILLPLVNASGRECVVLRPVASREAMTARFVPLKKAVLDGICEAAEALPGVGDIFFDITHKPPGTIEWE
ncbi:MAG: glutamine-hydrolyzing GMP synthase [Chitinivibrionales bacterium]|nr:glutamine-hydrolyzing GMP synthase [Chitinivibrionales bacterium]